MKEEINFEWYRIKIKNEKAQRKIDIKGFADKNKQMECYEEVRNDVNGIACQKTSQEKWNEICKVCTEADERVLGRVRHTKRYHWCYVRDDAGENGLFGLTGNGSRS